MTEIDSVAKKNICFSEGRLISFSIKIKNSFIWISLLFKEVNILFLIQPLRNYASLILLDISNIFENYFEFG